MRRGRRNGNSLIEFSLLTPWLIFLFVGALDWGFYAYALISTEAAARVGALYASGSTSTATDLTNVCKYVLGQLKKMPNVGSLSSCSSTPVVVTTTQVNGPDGNPAAQVVVDYQTPIFIPLMGSLPKQVTISRTVWMRLRS